MRTKSDMTIRSEPALADGLSSPIARANGMPVRADPEVNVVGQRLRVVDGGGEAPVGDDATALADRSSSGWCFRSSARAVHGAGHNPGHKTRRCGVDWTSPRGLSRLAGKEVRPR